MSLLKTKLGQLFPFDMFAIVFHTSFVRGLVAFGGLLLVIVIGKLYDASGVGIFAIAQALCIGVGILSRGGMDIALIKFASTTDKKTSLKQYLWWALRRSVIVSLSISALLFIIDDEIIRICGISHLDKVFPGICFAFTPFSTSIVLCSFLKSLNKPALACLFENGIILIVSAIVLVFLHYIGINKLEYIIHSISISSWLVTLFGLFKLRKFLSFRAKLLSTESYILFINASSKYFVSNISPFIRNFIIIIVASKYLSTEELGYYKLTERFSHLIGFILIVINAIFPPRFSKAYAENNFILLNNLFRQSIFYGLIVSTPIFVCLLLFSKAIFGLITEPVVNVSLLIFIFGFAQWFNACSGSVTNLLNMTDNEVYVRNIALLCNGTSLILCYFLISKIGLIGFTLIVALTIIFQNLISLYFANRNLCIQVCSSKNLSP